jgi:carboxymethylenebutenolidase
MIERQIEIPTADGATTTFITHPERGGAHPVILFLMDAPAIREELRDMCRRLASVGYYVMLPNLYYREGVLELEPMPAVRGPDHPWTQRMMALAGTLTIPMVMSDCAAMLDFANADPAAGDGAVGAVGYCLSGRFSIYTAAQFPDRIRAAASIYGTRFITERPDSPHLAIRGRDAEFYFACAEIDHWVPLNLVDELRQSVAEGGVKAEVELYPGAEHGFAFPQRHCYDRDAAERHWERLFALFARNLPQRNSA